MFDLNTVGMTGRLTKDATLRYTNGEKPVAVCNFTIAVKRSYAPEGSAQTSDFIPVVLWGNDAEFAGKFYKKGNHVGVKGELRSRTWKDDKGSHSVIELYGEKTSFVESKKNDNNTTGSNAVNQDNNDDQGYPDGFVIPDESDLPV